nr:hypothetical protein [Escherichia coli]
MRRWGPGGWQLERQRADGGSQQSDRQPVHGQRLGKR